MVRTGAFAYAKYGYETTFQTPVTADKKFGLQDKVGSWTLTNNNIFVELERQAFSLHKNCRCQVVRGVERKAK